MADVIFEQRIPDQIVAKNKSSQGIVKYRVKFSNGEEQWQNENHVRERYPHLLEDYNYYTITLTRYDPQLLEQKRLQYIQTSSFDPGNVENKIMKPLGKPPGKPINGSAKKNEKLKQKENKVIEIFETNDVQPQQKEIVANKPNNQQNQQQIRKEQVQITRQFEEEVIKTKMNSLLAKEVEQVRKSVKLRSAAEDKIQKIQFLEQQELFKIIWSQRQDGQIPLPDYFDYDSFKLNSPSLALRFLEQIYFKCKSDQDIQYEYVGDQTNVNKIIRSMINPIQEQNYETFQQLMAASFSNKDTQKQDFKLSLKKQTSKSVIGSESKPIEIPSEIQNNNITLQINDQQANNDTENKNHVEQPKIAVQQQSEKPPQQHEQNQQEEEKPIEEQEKQVSNQNSDENSQNIQNHQDDKEYLDLPDELFSQEEVRVPLNQDDY